MIMLSSNSVTPSVNFKAKMVKTPEQQLIAKAIDQATAIPKGLNVEEKKGVIIKSIKYLRGKLASLKKLEDWGEKLPNDDFRERAINRRLNILESNCYNLGIDPYSV